MTATQCDVIKTFLGHLSKANYDAGKDFMEKQRLSSSSVCELPKPLIEILCDFALAEKNYSEMKFQPANHKEASARKENENYLDYVYRTLLLNIGKVQHEIGHSYVKQFVTGLLHYIPVKLKLLELYVKLLEAGSSNGCIDYGELQEFVDEIPSSTVRTPSPVDGIMKILQFEQYCMKCLINCQFYLGHSLYIDSLLSMKKGNDIIVSWESHYEHKEANNGSVFVMKNTLPALILWFKRFKHMTVSKFTLYFYDSLLEQSSSNDINAVCNEYNIHILNKMQQLQNQPGAQSVLLMYDTLVDPNQKGHGIWGPIAYVTDPLNRYKTMLNFPQSKPKPDILESLLLENNKGDFLMNKIDLIVVENNTTLEFLNTSLNTLYCCWVRLIDTLYHSHYPIQSYEAAYLLIRVDLKITLVICYDSKPKNEKKLKSDVIEFVSQLRCHKIFSLINRFKDHYYQM